MLQSLWSISRGNFFHYLFSNIRSVSFEMSMVLNWQLWFFISNNTKGLLYHAVSHLCRDCTFWWRCSHIHYSGKSYVFKPRKSQNLLSKVAILGYVFHVQHIRQNGFYWEKLKEFKTVWCGIWKLSFQKFFFSQGSSGWLQ